MSPPASRRVPASGISSPAIMRSSVDFPQPEGPSKTTNSPSSAFSETPLTASREPNRLVMPSISSAMSAFHRAQRESAHQIFLRGRGEDQNGQHRDHARGAHFAPAYLVLRHPRRDSDGQRHRGLRLRQNQREQEFIPRDNQTENRGRGQARLDQR